jgi:hypothetical protein
LWHFPCIVLATGYFANKGAAYYLAAGVLPFILSAVSYHLIEDPIRHSNWLSQKPLRYHRRSATHWQTDNKRTLDGLLLLTGIVVMAGAVLVLKAPKQSDLSGQYAKAALTSSPSASPTLTLPTSGPATKSLQEQIAVALKATSWPSLNPSFDAVAAGPQAAKDSLNCSKIEAIKNPCSWGASVAEATHTVVLVGDSTATTYTTPLREIIEGMPGWRLKSLTMFGCIFTDATIPNRDPGVAKACPSHKSATVEAVNALKPDIVIVTNTYTSRIFASNHQKMTTSDYVASSKALISQFSPNVGKIVFLAPPPAEKELGVCYTPQSHPKDCVSHVSRDWKSGRDADMQLANDFKGIFVDTRVLFCNADNECPAFVGQVAVKMDIAHMSPQFQSFVKPSLAEVMLASKGL